MPSVVCCPFQRNRHSPRADLRRDSRRPSASSRVVFVAFRQRCCVWTALRSDRQTNTRYDFHGRRSLIAFDALCRIDGAVTTKRRVCSSIRVFKQPRPWSDRRRPFIREAKSKTTTETTGKTLRRFSKTICGKPRPSIASTCVYVRYTVVVRHFHRTDRRSVTRARRERKKKKPKRKRIKVLGRRRIFVLRFNERQKRK